ncbi:MAG: hypothetical protein M0Z41_13340 [Peptococcaceae bacterium]|nr:hypothetical protein [Peptococcaceae bacterium]
MLGRSAGSRRRLFVLFRFPAKQPVGQIFNLGRQRLDLLLQIGDEQGLSLILCPEGIIFSRQLNGFLPPPIGLPYQEVNRFGENLGIFRQIRADVFSLRVHGTSISYKMTRVQSMGKNPCTFF